MYNIGIDLGGTNIAVGVVDEKYNIVGRAKNKTNIELGTDSIIINMYETAKQAVTDAGLSMDDISTVGVAAPGTVNPATGVIAYANNLKFRNVAVGERLSQLFNKKCIIANDANAAAYGELLAGAGRGVKNFVAVTLGTGVGGGIVIDGKIYTGFNHAGAELGHMIVVPGGEHCTCGIDGCFEAYGSATALIRQTKAAMDADPDSKMWEISQKSGKVNGRTAFDGMRAGDATAKSVCEKYIEYLSIGITNLINIFQPEFICVGGGICNEGETLMAPLREMCAKNDYNKMLPQKTRICKAELGNDAGIIGAAFLFKQQ